MPCHSVLARHHGIPFYAALPLSTIDFDCENGDAIPIEERDAAELRTIPALDSRGSSAPVPLTVEDAPVWNPAFDVTPAALVSAIITEAGAVPASAEGLASLRRA